MKEIDKAVRELARDALDDIKKTNKRKLMYELIFFYAGVRMCAQLYIEFYSVEPNEEGGSPVGNLIKDTFDFMGNLTAARVENPYVPIDMLIQTEVRRYLSERKAKENEGKKGSDA